MTVPDSGGRPLTEHSPHRLLIVEDEAVVSIHVRRMLEQLGHDIVGIAASEQEAIDLAERYRPDLVLMDIKLQGDSRAGIKAAGYLWKEHRMPVIYTTAYADEGTIEGAVATIPFGFLRKPFQTADLQAAIQVALARRAAEQAEEMARLEAEMRAAQLRRLARFGMAALESSNTSEVIDHALSVACLTDACSACVMTVSDAMVFFQVVALKGLEASAEARFPSARTPHAEALGTAQPVLVSDCAQDERFTLPDFLQDNEVQSVICAAIVPSGSPWGALSVHSTARGEFNEHDAQYVQEIANIIGAALERERSARQVLELSNPILRLGEHLLMVPIVGNVDENRAGQTEDRLLDAVRNHRAKAVVIDVTGVASLGDGVAARLCQTILAMHLLGAKVILTGVSSSAAHELVREASAAAQELWTAGDLQAGIEAAVQWLARGTARHR